MIIDWQQIQQKWQEKWLKEKVFEPVVDKSKKKFFLNTPYPYVNSILHIGHLYTYMRTEALARFKRMQVYNVLFPQAWHATGSPIVSSAKRVKDKEPKQLKILKDIGITESQIKKFEKPEYWIEYFRPKIFYPVFWFFKFLYLALSNANVFQYFQLFWFFILYSFCRTDYWRTGCVPCLREQYIIYLHSFESGKSFRTHIGIEMTNMK